MSVFDKKPSDTITKFSVVAIVLGVLFLVTGAAEAAEPASWNSVTFHGETADGYSLTLEEEFRYGDTSLSGDASRHTDIRVGKKFDGFTGILGYRDTNDSANRTYAGVSYDLGDVSGWHTGVSSIFEWKGNEDVRNRTKFYAQKGEDVIGFSPYVTTEFFANTDGNVYSNRSAFGLAKDLGDGYAIDAYYQKDKSFGGGSDSDAIGFGLNIAL